MNLGGVWAPTVDGLPATVLAALAPFSAQSYGEHQRVGNLARNGVDGPCLGGVWEALIGCTASASDVKW